MNEYELHGRKKAHQFKEPGCTRLIAQCKKLNVILKTNAAQ